MRFIKSLLKKKRALNNKLLLSFLLALAPCLNVQALTVVRMNTQLSPVITGNVDILLYDEETPLTVANFLGLVNTGQYDNLIINRSVPGFIIQAGRYAYVPEYDFTARFESAYNSEILETFTEPTTGELGLRPIDELYFIDANDDGIKDLDAFGDPLMGINSSLQLRLVDMETPLLNEPGISNLRGTLAMAKIPAQFYEADCIEEGPGCTLVPGTGPDSALNEWFVNLTDNSANLDAQNGGFTVFGHIIGSGMNYFDAVSAQTLHPFVAGVLGGGFSSLPVINADGSLYPPVGGGAVYNDNMAKVNSASEILHIDVSNTDFGIVTIGGTAQTSIVLTNTGSAPITINKFQDLDVLLSPYSVFSDNCSGAVDIQPSGTCTVVLELNPTAGGFYNDSADFSFISPDIPNVTVELFGVGSTGVNPDIFVDRAVDFGTGTPGSDVLTHELLVTNLGQAPLTILSIDPPSGVDAYSFWMGHDCVSLPLGSSCIVTLKFNTLVDGFGDKASEIIINTDDPDSPAVTVSLAGFGGDGNNDNVVDSAQGHVSSLALADGGYVTVAVANDDGFHDLSNVREVTNPSPSDAPNISFSNGFIAFDVAALSSGFEIGIILPANSGVNTYYQYGVTPDNDVPHWYEFMFDPETGTGATILRNVTIEAPNGLQIQRDMVMLNYMDGSRGDNEFLSNGSVSVVGAVGRAPSEDTGQLGLLVLFLMLLSVCSFRTRSIIKKNIFE